jgi:hypothetical protein
VLHPAWNLDYVVGPISKGKTESFEPQWKIKKIISKSKTYSVSLYIPVVPVV